MVCFSVPGVAGEHLSIPGHDNVEGSQNDCGGKARGPHPARGPNQSAHLHYGGQPNVSDVRAPRTVREVNEFKSLKKFTFRHFVITIHCVCASYYACSAHLNVFSLQGREESDPSAKAAAGRGLSGLPSCRPGERQKEKGGAGATEARGGEGQTEWTCWGAETTSESDFPFRMLVCTKTKFKFANLSFSDCPFLFPFRLSRRRRRGSQNAFLQSHLQMIQKVSK